MNTNRQKNQVIKHLDFILLDIFVLEVSFYLSFLFYPNNLSLHFRNIESVSLFLCIWITILSTNPYRKILRRNRWTELKKCFNQTIFILVLNVLVLYFTHDASNISRLTIILTFIIYFVIGYFAKVILKRFIRRRLLHGSKDKRSSLVIVSSERRAQGTVEYLTADIFVSHIIKGIFLIDYDKERDDNRKINGIPVLGDTDDLLDYATHNWVDEVVLNLRHHLNTCRDLENHFEKMGITYHRVIFRLTDYEDNYPHIEKLGNYIVMTKTIRDVPLMQIFLKRALDIFGALIGLLFTGIVYLFIAPQIKKADPGPVFYAANRVGRNGKLR